MSCWGRVRVGATVAFLAASFWCGRSLAQEGSDWRRIGTSAIDDGLAGWATGPVDRIWYSPDGSRLLALGRGGRTFVSDDFETWRPVNQAIAAPPESRLVSALSSPEPAALLRSSADKARIYALGAAAHRSDDAGLTWIDLTSIKNRSSVIGGGLRDLAASPRDPDEIAVAGDFGVWRSAYGGRSWTGLNRFLPNLPLKRILSLPNGVSGLRISLNGPDRAALEWAPGEKSAWRRVSDVGALADETLASDLAKRFSAPVEAVARSSSWIYAGSSDGQIWSSSDSGGTWSLASDRLAGPVESIYVSPRDGRIALAAVSGRSALPGQPHPARILRTMNGGIFWDDITANLPDFPAHGVAADPQSGAVYAATDAGLFLTWMDLGAAGRATTWVQIPLPAAGGPGAAAIDVKLDAGGNQLFAAIPGFGVYSTLAPHRLKDARIVNAADFSGRPASPGSLLSVIGANVQKAQVSGFPVPILAATDRASQIQVPFEANGGLLALSIDTATSRINFGLALRAASPAIFVDPDGAPLILDGESGILLDADKPARARTRVQILATGLGRVRPEWPTGVAAPLADPPAVSAPVRAFVDGLPVAVTQATLAPGYVGFYMVEVELPAIVNLGPADLYLDVDGQPSNHVRIYLAR